MSFSPFDWILLIVLCLFFFGAALWTRRLTRSVSDFLAANRCAGRYLLTLADGAAGFGVVTLVANFEKFYQAGFGAFWWGMLLGPLGSIAALSGWVAYRYRETRAMTMAEFFERRYSRKFRIFAGSLCFISGLLNYGIFPMVTANLLSNLFGFSETFVVFGLDLSTRAAIMIVLLSIAATFTLGGGLITVMVTDFIQSQILFLALLAITLVFVFRFEWPVAAEGLQMAAAGRSMIDPFDQKLVDSFNLFFFCVFGFKIFYNYLGWQGSQGYFAAAKSPHEFRMSRILGEWRGATLYLAVLIVPIGAFVFMLHPMFAEQAAGVKEALGLIKDPQLVKQLTVPTVLAWLLPAGVLGLFTAALIFAAIATDDTQLHSWGSIFVQDILIPIRGRPLSTEAHMLALRLAVVGVAGFAFFWSMVFPLRDYVLMYMLATGTIYLGGSGAVIIGGLYWRRATTAGAYSAMVTGATIGVVGVLAQGFWSYMTFFHQWIPKFPLNGVQIALSSYIVSIVVFVSVSLLTSRELFNLEKLLHRGVYALPEEGDTTPHTAGEGRLVPTWQRRLGINHFFTKGDKAIYFLQMGWVAFWFIACIIGTTLALTIGISADSWLSWWKLVIIISILAGMVTLVWFMIGGIADFRELVRKLMTEKPDARDDGWVK